MEVHQVHTGDGTVNPLAQKVLVCTNRALGGIGESFIRRQCQLCGFQLDDIDRPKLERLAKAASSNSVLIVGKARAEKLHADLIGLAKAAF